MNLHDLDLSSAFASTTLSAEIPAEAFAHRATRRLPSSIVPPARPESAREPELLVIGSLLGKFRLERLIGMGGFGVVYRARHVVLDNVVAVKLMRPSVARARPALLRLLTEEARLAARITHPNVVRVHDVEVANGHTYVVMEYVDGPDLSVLIKRRGALQPKMVVRLLRHVVAALAAGYAENLVHRDVKPSNILLTADRVTKLADFGLARSNAGAGAGLLGVVGTASYMSPEQSTHPDRVDFRSDIYSLGVTAYEALTGKLVTLEGGRLQLAAPAQVVAGVPGRLSELVMTMIAPSPSERPESYAALDDALRRAH